jgi:protein TonB
MAFLLRYTTFGLLALLVTFALFYMMQSLISMDAGKGKEFARGGSIEFVRLKRESETEARQRRMPKKMEQNQPPPKTPELNLSKSQRPGSGGVAVSIPTMDASVEMAGGLNLGAGPANAEATPILRVPPIYPSRAAQRGIEGWVFVEFTITPTGAVANPVVVESHPSSIFNRAALRSIKKWKYRPKIVDGTAVERHGIRTKIEFGLGDD